MGWADVATKHDLMQLEARMDLRFEAIDHRFESLEHRMTSVFERGLRQQLVTMMSLFVTGFPAVILAVVLAVTLR